MKTKSPCWNTRRASPRAVPSCQAATRSGATVTEAIANIRDAIRDYVELHGEPDVRCEVRELEMAVV